MDKERVDNDGTKMVKEITAVQHQQQQLQNDTAAFVNFICATKKYK